MTEEQNEVVENVPAQEAPQDAVIAGQETPESQETVAEQPTQPPDIEPGFEPTIESVVEAVLFASDEPISAARLAEIAGINAKQLHKIIDDLNEKYKTGNNAFRIEQIAAGLQMLTLPGYSHWLKKLIRAREDSKLSQPALETLAIIAYKQPIIRADIEAIRGVAAGEMIRNLMYKGLVKITGRAEVLGRPMLYGTTKKFLEVFGLNSLKDLPKAEELKKPE
jgi:segregation and condensation protein B